MDKTKLEKLLRLATNNPNEEEARTAAVAFCRGLVAVKAQIHLPDELPPFTPTVAPPVSPWPFQAPTPYRAPAPPDWFGSRQRATYNAAFEQYLHEMMGRK